VLSGRDNDHLRRLAALTVSQDPVFAGHLAAGRPVAPHEYRRARRRSTALLTVAAACLTAAVFLSDSPVLSGVSLLACLVSATAVMFHWPPAQLDAAPPEGQEETR
jgi:hypothetical protein